MVHPLGTAGQHIQCWHANDVHMQAVEGYERRQHAWAVRFKLLAGVTTLLNFAGSGTRALQAT
jgi:hypothetical protein